MTRNLPLSRGVGLRGVVAAALLTVFMSASASPIAAQNQQGLKASEGGRQHSVGNTWDDTPTRMPEIERSLAASGFGAGVEERTETLLTYFGIEPRLVLPSLSPGGESREFGVQYLKPEDTEFEASAVPELKEMLVLVVGAMLVGAGIAFRGWLGGSG